MSSPAQRLVEFLAQNCRGRERGIRARELAPIVFGSTGATAERLLREVVNKLRASGYPICAHPTYGYWWAADVEEIDRAAAWLRVRGLEHLRQESRLRRLGPAYLEPRQGELIESPIQIPPLESGRYVGPPNDPALISIPDSLIAELRAQAAARGVPLNDLVLEKLRG